MHSTSLRPTPALHSTSSTSETRDVSVPASPSLSRHTSPSTSRNPAGHPPIPLPRGLSASSRRWSVWAAQAAGPLAESTAPGMSHPHSRGADPCVWHSLSPAGPSDGRRGLSPFIFLDFPPEAVNNPWQQGPLHDRLRRQPDSSPLFQIQDEAQGLPRPYLRASSHIPRPPARKRTPTFPDMDPSCSPEKGGARRPCSEGFDRRLVMGYKWWFLGHMHALLCS